MMDERGFVWNGGVYITLQGRQYVTILSFDFLFLDRAYPKSAMCGTTIAAALDSGQCMNARSPLRYRRSEDRTRLQSLGMEAKATCQRLEDLNCGVSQREWIGHVSPDETCLYAGTREQAAY